MTDNTGVEVTQDYYGYPVETIIDEVTGRFSDWKPTPAQLGFARACINATYHRIAIAESANCSPSPVPGLVFAKDLPLTVRMAGAKAITLDLMNARANYDAACDCWDAMVKALCSPIANEIEFNGFNEDVADEGPEFFAESAKKSPDPAEGLAADLSDAVVQDILYAKDVAEARKRIGFALAALASTEAAVAEAVEPTDQQIRAALEAIGKESDELYHLDDLRAFVMAIRSTTDGGEA